MAVRSLLRASAGAWVLAVALPIVLVHVDFQPGFTVTAGSTHAHIVLSDLAVLAVLAAGIAVATREGLGRLRYGTWAWIAIGAFLLLVVAACFYPRSSAYPRNEHIVTAGKYVEYALLAPAAALIVRRTEDFALLVFTLVRASAPKAPMTDGPIAGATPVNTGGAGSPNPNVLHPRAHDGFASAAVAEGFVNGFANGAVIATPLAATTDVLGLETARRFQSHVVWARANSHRIETGHDEPTMRLAWDNMQSMRLCGKVLQELQNCHQIKFEESEMKVELDLLIAQLDRLQQPSPEALRGVLPVLRENPRLADIVSQVNTRPGTPPEQQQLVLQRISLMFPDVFQTELPTVSIDESFNLDPTSIRTFQGPCGLRMIFIGGQLGFPAPLMRAR